VEYTDDQRDRDIAEAGERVKRLTDQQARSALHYLSGFSPGNVNLAISTIQALEMDREAE
jgi:hypothetical protein